MIPSYTCTKIELPHPGWECVADMGDTRWTLQFFGGFTEEEACRRFEIELVGLQVGSGGLIP